MASLRGKLKHQNQSWARFTWDADLSYARDGQQESTDEDLTAMLMRWFVVLFFAAPAWLRLGGGA
jgi:hypothetical protein